MRTQLLSRKFRIIYTTFIFLAIQILLIVGLQARIIQANQGITPSDRRVNVPDLSGASFTPAIFWFGKVDPTSNNADVRVYYYDSQISVVVHIMDRLLWFDPSQSRANLTKWDAVSLYMNMDGDVGGVPGTNAFLFQSQLDLQATYRGDGKTWKSTPIPLTVETTWRGNYPNDTIEDKGWQVQFDIPFTSLGLSKAPPKGTIWGLAVAVHDRDNEGGSPPIPDQTWPEAAEPNVPSTWGQLHFGIPGYNPPDTIVQKVVTLRDGLNGVQVEDAHVGGHTTCGAEVDHWSKWGDTNYAGYQQINIQNQWDIADWPCFSKYYLTFPLDSLPAGKVILSAKLTMVLFGNSGGGVWGEPPDSYIQVLTVNQDWEENTITWNNAPLAWENISGTWVKPRDYEKPDQPYQWDVSRAVNQAYKSGEPLRLALYSADGERHTGKYFWSSDVEDSNAVVRPALQIMLGVPCTGPGITCRYIFIPLTTE